LKLLDSNLKKVKVEEMAFFDDGFVQDARFTKGTGYASAKYPGMVFQKDLENDFISKIRLTKNFAGWLPDGEPIHMKNLLAKNVIKIISRLQRNLDFNRLRPLLEPDQRHPFLLYKN